MIVSVFLCSAIVSGVVLFMCTSGRWQCGKRNIRRNSSKRKRGRTKAIAELKGCPVSELPAENTRYELTADKAGAELAVDEPSNVKNVKIRLDQTIEALGYDRDSNLVGKGA